MKSACCFLLMVLLLMLLANATSMAAREPGLGKGLERLLAGNSPDMQTSGRSKQLTVTTDTTKEKEDAFVGNKCITFEHCKKKRMACAKECSRPRGRIDMMHFPGKCFLKCKKCIPTC